MYNIALSFTQTHTFSVREADVVSVVLLCLKIGH